MTFSQIFALAPVSWFIVLWLLSGILAGMAFDVVEELLVEWILKVQNMNKVKDQDLLDIADRAMKLKEEENQVYNSDERNARRIVFHAIFGLFSAVGVILFSYAIIGLMCEYAYLKIFNDEAR